MIDSHAKVSFFAPEASGRRSLAMPIAVALFALLTALGAHVAVPLGITPVPMTLQTLFVLLAGALLGPVAGATSQLLYLGLGVAGVPVFAMGGAGPPWIFGPTGGYLMAFPLAAALVGWISGSEGHALRTAVALVVGSAVIFVMGAGWLSVVNDFGPGALFVAAVQPFLVGAVVKAVICFVVTRQIVARGRRR
ncbi:MAG: biotin transporter BioY [Gemmatimonadota bacterium]|nr:biotin transporter BioY [Gemmatimonadota bacterium]MDE2863720.1 biotin transporter BioY [Gemmatimonadota bacterium]